MTLVHDDSGFDDLLRIVAAERKLAVGLIEKDYWVTHTLWALHDVGFEVWFKGGTSLSKGFGLIERFSEDLDVKIEAGTVAALPKISNWKSEGKPATATRKAYFEALSKLLKVPAAKTTLDSDVVDRAWRSANFRVSYPGNNLATLHPTLRPFVLLEVGSARVTPAVPRDMTSFVHEHLEKIGQLADFDDNRPRAVRCVHPLVTLLEKLDAIHRRVPNVGAEPAAFVRHFEDAARIIGGASRIPILTTHADVGALADDLLGERQIVQLPDVDDAAFTPYDSERWHAIRDTHAAIAPTFWGERISIDECCKQIRDWIGSALKPTGA